MSERKDSELSFQSNLVNDISTGVRENIIALTQKTKQS